MTTIQVLSRTQKIIVDERSKVRIVNAGPIGPPGLPGSGVVGVTYANGIQTAPLSVWILDHNLDYFPAAVKFNTLDGLDELEPESLTYVDTNRILATWPSPTSGTWMIS